MKRTVRRILSLLLSLAMLTVLSSCGASKKEPTPLTMYVGLGNNSPAYCLPLHDLILENTGVDVQFVYTSSLDGSTAAVNCIANHDLPADIMVTASATDKSLQADAFLDLAAETNIPNLFRVSKIQEYSLNGAVYQIPFTSRLIGVEYNKTLLGEMGWELPETYSEMVELKEKVEAAGYPIAVSGGVATGHGFNYLFHLMGSQFLCTPDGNQWFTGFQDGEATIDLLETESEYFRKYADSGLFGTIHNSDWLAGAEFCRTRALFYYNIINDAYSYDGFRYNTDGTLYGAEYAEDGTVKAVPDKNGNAVLIDGSYVFYDSENPDMADLERYSIPGTVELHDTYASMPWITENGSSNSFTMYDNMFVALDRDLGNPENRQKLEDAVKVLEFMTTEPCTDLYSGFYSDGYVATNDYSVSESRLYSEYADRVNSGYLIPWYYNFFDMDSIMNVGATVNAYLLKDSSVSFGDIFDGLDYYNQNRLNGQAEIAAEVSETLDYAQTAAVEAAANGMSLQNSLDAAGYTEEVTVSLMPYTESLNDLPLFTSLGVVQQKIYGGDFKVASFRSCISPNANNPVAVKLTGAEIEELTAEGYIYTDEDGNELCFPYVCVVKGGGSLDPDAEYVVAVSDGSLSKQRRESLKSAGKVIEGVNGTTEEGLALLTAANPVITADAVLWK